MTAQAFDTAGTAQAEPLWEVKIGSAAGQFFTSRRKAAEGLVRLAEHRMKQGRPLNFTVLRLDDEDKPDRDASSDVAEVFAATGYPANDDEGLREGTIDCLEAILPSDFA
ncbi:hypothetical protein GC088_06820 [Arthrobacter sp. JZ12]|uniref:hypothetical protein n=1 Tax=Arthrobacter sp. JZ12 TaxID=2654190 RepID=UPI002B460C9F|nr:hypothetical protein [Arthrobacter sp. JZ12]WRH24810.1 hypothetical protein GC088_06820 [Arthrobacter sp. JZ12]